MACLPVEKYCLPMSRLTVSEYHCSAFFHALSLGMSLPNPGFLAAQSLGQAGVLVLGAKMTIASALTMATRPKKALERLSNPSWRTARPIAKPTSKRPTKNSLSGFI
jgi:hypothetical protein